MKFKMIHENYNVSDLNKSMAVIDRETVEHEKDADVPADTKEAN